MNNIKWNEMYKLKKFNPQYPSETIVRFLFTNFNIKKNKKILDIGCGNGRHVKLFAEQGFDVYGCDYSKEGINQTKKMLKKFNLNAKIKFADMTNLPYEDNFFDGIVSYGVFYYGNSKIMKKAIDELYRVLKIGGKAIIITRTNEDYRFNKGKKVEHNTYILDINETNEKGMILHFLSKEDVFEYYSKFKKIILEKNNFTLNNREILNSDWIITVEG